MKKVLSIAVLVFGAYYAWNHLGFDAAFSGSSNGGDSVLANAFRNQATNLQVEGRGEVVRILADDDKGSRHQRFILGLDSGRTLLVAHNIDLAPRVASLREGDSVEFYGEYEWNSQGGVIHWTHHDPQGNHVTGWLRHNGRTYK